MYKNLDFNFGMKKFLLPIFVLVLLTNIKAEAW